MFTGVIEMKQRGLTFPKRWEESTARAQRDRSVSSNVCYFKADFVLMRDEHQGIAIWSNFEDEVSFVVGACERARPGRKAALLLHELGARDPKQTEHPLAI